MCPCFFQLPEAAHLPWLVAPSSSCDFFFFFGLCQVSIAAQGIFIVAHGLFVAHRRSLVVHGGFSLVVVCGFLLFGAQAP